MIGICDHNNIFIKKIYNNYKYITEFTNSEMENQNGTKLIKT